MRSLTRIIAGLLCTALAVLLLLSWGGVGRAAHDAWTAFRGTLAGGSVSTAAALALENQRLAAELALATASSCEPVVADGGAAYRAVLIYSRYPFIERDALVVAMGSADGLATGTPVLAARGIALGTITSVSTDRAEVRTIMSPDSRVSVTIGTSTVKAVLHGGNPATLDLIPKDAMVMPGDFVYTIDPVFPFHLLVGTVRTVTADPHDSWQTATVDIPFVVDSLDRVLVPVQSR